MGPACCGLVLLWWFVVFFLGLCFWLVVVFVFRVSLPINMQCFLPFYDDLGTPPTWRPHSWKKETRQRQRQRRTERGEGRERERDRERYQDETETDRERRGREGERKRERGREIGPSPAQTQVGRRPAVRRKPHNKIVAKSGHQAWQRSSPPSRALSSETYTLCTTLVPSFRCTALRSLLGCPFVNRFGFVRCERSQPTWIV